MIARARNTLALLLAVGCVQVVLADSPDAPPLGPVFGESTDVTFKLFPDAKPVDLLSRSEIGRFENAAKHWTLSYAKTELPNPQAMKDTTDARGGITPGFLTIAANQLRSTAGGADLLRNEVIDLGNLAVGVLVAQTSDKNQSVLLQEAFVQISSRIYYSIAITSPCPTRDIEKNPGVIDATRTFNAIIDSIARNDLSAIRRDQEDRLIRTRALFVNWNTKRIVAALKPEQYLLFKRAGQPIGYAYVVEQPANATPKAGEVDKGVVLRGDEVSGFRVGVRSRVATEPGKSADAESWMYVSFDRRHEVWSNVTLNHFPAARSEKEKETWFSEVGATDIRRERVFDKNLKPEDFTDLDQRTKADKNAGVPFQEVDKYRLTVRTEGRSAVAAPIQRELPPFYLPQALGMLLPRIVPLNYPTGYMFATFSADNREVMTRYLDVKPECDIKLNGKEYRAVPVVDRIGLSGPPTTHYMSPAGEYLGSVSEGTKLEVIPTDHDALVAVFKDANLTQPNPVKE